jgi:hypothetical protein
MALISILQLTLTLTFTSSGKQRDSGVSGNGKQPICMERDKSGAGLETRSKQSKAIASPQELARMRARTCMHMYCVGMYCGTVDGICSQEQSAGESSQSRRPADSLPASGPTASGSASEDAPQKGERSVAGIRRFRSFPFLSSCLSCKDYPSYDSVFFVFVFFSLPAGSISLDLVCPTRVES